MDNEKKPAMETVAAQIKQNLPAYLLKPLKEVAVSDLSDNELFERCKTYGMNAKLWSRRFAGLLPEVAKRGLHRRKGFRSIQEFAGKVAGMSEYATDRILQLYEKIKDKPSLLNLFESGAESWSKIIKVAYVATAVNEKLWAEKVTILSAGALEVLVQNYRLKSVHMNQPESKNLFGQVEAVQDFPTFEPPVRFSFPASREVEFDLRLAKQKLEKQAKQPLSWNETFQKIIEQSELAKTGAYFIKKAPLKLLPDVCTKCAKTGAVVKICEECSKKIM